MKQKCKPMGFDLDQLLVSYGNPWFREKWFMTSVTLGCTTAVTSRAAMDPVTATNSAGN